MADFLLSPQGTTAIILCGILAAVGYILLEILDCLWSSDYDPMIEKKCRKCVYYDRCIEHGCHYDCYYYTDTDMIKRRGVDDDD